MLLRMTETPRHESLDLSGGSVLALLGKIGKGVLFSCRVGATEDDGRITTLLIGLMGLMGVTGLGEMLLKETHS